MKGLLKATEAQQAEITRFKRHTLDALEKMETEERDLLRYASVQTRNRLREELKTEPMTAAFYSLESCQL